MYTDSPILVIKTEKHESQCVNDMPFMIQKSKICQYFQTIIIGSKNCKKPLLKITHTTDSLKPDSATYLFYLKFLIMKQNVQQN